MLEEDFFQVGLFSIRVGLFLARGGLFSIGVGLFLVGGGLFLSPTVAEKSPTPAEKSPTAILKRCWTLEYFGELEFSSPFMEQWTLDARGVLFNNFDNFVQGEGPSLYSVQVEFHFISRNYIKKKI